MRFLADENFPGAAVRALREAGHDIVSVIDNAPGADDSDMLRRAACEGRILLTFDKDFGELAKNAAPPAVCSVVLFHRLNLKRLYSTLFGSTYGKYDLPFGDYSRLVRARACGAPL